jgi:hypothetical protein
MSKTDRVKGWEAYPTAFSTLRFMDQEKWGMALMLLEKAEN